MEAEGNLIKFMLPEIQKRFLTSKSKMEEDFRIQMEKKDKELELLNQTLTQLREETKESTLKKQAQEESREVVPQNSKCNMQRTGSI